MKNSGQTVAATLSITIIGHNESVHLKELLPQLSWVDEVVYVDCESSDDSLEIATQMGCRTFSRPNNPNLNVNKAFAIEQATGDWIFYLDPDERIPEALAREIRRRISANPIENGFQMNRRNHYFGYWLKHGSQYPDVQLRLFRKGKARFPQQHVHEKIQVEGKVGKLHNDLLHFPYTSVSQYLQKFDFYTSFEAHYLHQHQVKPGLGTGLRFLFFIPITRFIRRYFFKGGFLDGLPGFFACFFDSVHFMVRYLKLWEIYRQDEGKTP